MKKLIRYRLPVSRIFPKGHPKEGQPTYFVEKIENAINGCSHCDAECNTCLKLHTIRANYPLWEKRMKKVLAGEAVIELFYWENKPYRSKQIVFATLNKDSGCGIQELIFAENHITDPWVFKQLDKNTTDKQDIEVFKLLGLSEEPENYIADEIEIEDIAKNDGLSLEDFKAWFKGYDLTKPMAIIQFTKFRY